MPNKSNQARSVTTEERLEVQAQEIRRLRAELRAQAQAARQEARVEMRTRYRVAIAGLTIGALLIGGAVGHWGIPCEEAVPAAQSSPPAARWAPVVPLIPTVDGDRTAEDTRPWPLRVYVSGAVAAPQIVTLPAGSLVADAVEAAGGPDADADLESLNLAAPVEDGQHVHVPHVDAPSGEGMSTPTARTGSEPIDINRASVEELATLPYIGEVKAAAIVAYRTTHGAFGSIEEIQEVPGIGPTTFGKIAEFITAGP
jgi:competence protein ComEA